MAKSDYFSSEARASRRTARLTKMSGMSNLFKSAIREKSAASIKITTQTAGVHAVSLIRSILNNYALPGVPKLAYSGLRNGRTAAHSSRLEEGVITVNASFKSTSGVQISFDIPVEIHEGKLLEPSIIVHNGEPRIIAQSSFDNIASHNTIRDDMPVRKMYDGPLMADAAKDMYTNRMKYTKVNKGIFSASVNKENLRRAMRGQTMTAQVHPGMAGVAYRVMMDEPAGVCVGFEPSGVEYDEFPLLSDDGGHSVGITEHGMFITSDPSQATEPPDLMVWRTPEHFEEWLAEMSDAADFEDDHDAAVRTPGEQALIDGEGQAQGACQYCSSGESAVHGTGGMCQSCYDKEFQDKQANQYIKQQGGSWVITQKGTGKVLSHHDSKEKAEAAFAAMEMNKHGARPKPPKGLAIPKAFKPAPVKHDSCSRCNYSPCMCAHGKKPTASVYRPIVRTANPELVAKVNREVGLMQDDGLSSIDIKQAVASKYGPQVAALVFKDE